MSWLLLAAHVLIILVAAVLISANRKPTAAIAWILAIILVPVVGVVFFMLVGFGKLPRKRRDRPFWRVPTALIKSVIAMIWPSWRARW